MSALGLSGADIVTELEEYAKWAAAEKRGESMPAYRMGGASHIQQVVDWLEAHGYLPPCDVCHHDDCEHTQREGEGTEEC